MGGSGSVGPSIGSLPGVETSARAADGSGAGSGDGFGAAMQQAMGESSPRAQVGAHKPLPAAGGTTETSAKQQGAPAPAPKSEAAASAPGSADAGSAVAANGKQAVPAKPLTAAEKSLPAQVPIQMPTGRDAGAKAPAASQGDAKIARDAQGTPDSQGTQHARQTVAARGGEPPVAAKGSATDTVAGASAQRDGGKLTKAVANDVSENATKALTEAVKSPAGGTPHADPTEKKGFAGQTGERSGAGKTNAQAEAKPAAKTEAKKKADHPPAIGPGAGSMAPPAVVAAALAAPAAGPPPGKPGHAPDAGKAAAKGGLKEGTAGRIEGQVGAVMAPARGAGTVAGQPTGKSTASEAEPVRGAPGGVTLPRSGSVSAKGAGTGIDAARAARGAEQAASGTAPGSVAPGSGVDGTAIAAHAAHGGGGGHAGVGSGARTSLAQAGVGLANPQARHPESKSSVPGASGASGPAAHGFTASLLQGHSGMNVGTAAGMAAAGQNGAQHAAGLSVGAGAAHPYAATNPYTQMDRTQGHTLVYASPQKMSVAVSDPSLGNFQVRAQNAGAQVAASLATASAATHAQLSGHLPALTSFLQDQRVDVARVTLVQPSLLGGDAGPRDFGGQQRQGRSGARGGKSQAGRVGAVGHTGLGSGTTMEAVTMDSGDGGTVSASVGNAARGHGSSVAAGGGMASVDLMA